MCWPVQRSTAQSRAAHNPPLRKVSEEIKTFTAAPVNHLACMEEIRTEAFLTSVRVLATHRAMMSSLLGEAGRCCWAAWKNCQHSMDILRISLTQPGLSDPQKVCGKEEMMHKVEGIHLMQSGRSKERKWRSPRYRCMLGKKGSKIRREHMELFFFEAKYAPCLFWIERRNFLKSAAVSKSRSASSSF